MKANGWNIIRIPTPSLNIDNKKRYYITFLIKLILNIRLVFFKPKGIYHINIGQSLFSFFREGYFVYINYYSLTKNPCILSLHGDWFMHWNINSINSKLLSSICNKCKFITVLSDRQRNRLILLGVNESCIRIVPNTTDLIALNKSDILIKQCNNNFINIVFLSSLIDTKGYIEFLDAINLFNKFKNNIYLNVKICGQILKPNYSESKDSIIQLTNKFVSLINEINKSDYIKILWIPNVEGYEKYSILKDCNIYVLPTKVDAQPISILEAMATGCAIVTTRVGDIEDSIGVNSALYLDNITPLNIYNCILNYINNKELRILHSLECNKRYLDYFDIKIHENKWITIFNMLK